MKNSAQFGSRVFPRTLIKKLPKPTAQNWEDTLDGTSKLDNAHADLIAETLKNWALQQGATHFVRNFQPAFQVNIEKYEWFSKKIPLEQLSADELLSRGLDHFMQPLDDSKTGSVWDPATLPFLWEEGGELLLCIPSILIFAKEPFLDCQIPLLRSEKKLASAVSRLLRLCGKGDCRVFSSLRLEQEFLMMDRSFFLMRPDLVLSGRSLFDARTSVEDIDLDEAAMYLREVEKEALLLGISMQPEPLNDARASTAIGQNLLFIELLRALAVKHGFVCLLHEKPFMGLPGSGKPHSWSIRTDTGQNLLNPTENRLVASVLLVAFLRAVHEHSGLIKASLSSPGNDYRLGSLPPILSVSLGDDLKRIIEEIFPERKKEDFFGSQDNPSFFSFDKGQIEFRAAGASTHSALPVTVIQAMVADSLHLILDEAASVIGDRQFKETALFEMMAPILAEYLTASQRVFWNRGSPSAEWGEEPSQKQSSDRQNGFPMQAHWVDKKTVRIFEGVLSEEELHRLYHIEVERYVKTMRLEVDLMIELFQTQILPAAQKDMIQRGVEEPFIDSASKVAQEMKKLQLQTEDMGWEGKGSVYCELIQPKTVEFRVILDQLEGVVDEALWPWPKHLPIFPQRRL